MTVRFWKVLGAAVLLGGASIQAQDEAAPAPPSAWSNAKPALRRLDDSTAAAGGVPARRIAAAELGPDDLPPIESEPAELPRGDDLDQQPINEPELDPAEPGPADPSPADPGAEVLTERHQNGRPRIERTVMREDGAEAVNHGPWTMFNPSGAKVAWGEYRHGEREGRWTRIYSSAQELKLDPQQIRGFQPPFTSEADFENGKLNGEWTIKDAAGRTVEVWPFENGQLHGMVVQYHANGQLRSEAPYEGGVPTGVAKRYDSQGQVTGSETFINGRKLTPLVKRFGNGKPETEGNYLAATTQVNAEGDWWNAEIKPEVVTIHDRPVKEGWWTHYHPSGERRFTGEYRDGRPVGTHTWWFPNGQTQTQGGFEDGKQQGLWTWWRENGQKQQEGGYQDGKPEKNWVRFDANGTPISTSGPAEGETAAPNRQRFPRQPAPPARPQASRSQSSHPSARTAVVPPARGQGWKSAQVTDLPDQVLQPTDDAALLPVPMEESELP